MGGPSEAPKAVTLKGRWGALRPLEADRDAAALFHLTHDAGTAAKTWAEMKVGPFADEAAFRAHVDELLADRSRSFYAISQDGDAPLGWLCLMETQAAHSSIELGYVVFGPPLQRTTLATEAFYLIMVHVFDDLGFRRLEWTCTAQNERSRRAADRLGFAFEGIMRSKLVLKGATRDIAMYSLLAHEWPSRRESMRAWLDPANFVDGVQVEPLAMPGGAGA